MSRQLTVLYTHSRRIGYGRQGVDLVAALRRMGYDIHDWVEGWPIEPVDKIENPGLDETVLWCSVPVHVTGWFKGQHPAIFTMWEATRLPEQFRENLHEFDVCIVPSEQNAELFSKYHPNVHYVPLGVDPSWTYTPRREPSVFFDFLTAGSGARKGADVAWEAFQKAFPDPESMTPIPRLIHKSPRGQELDGVETVSGRLTDDAELDLYASAHCYVQLSRGEGFGLQPLQAIASGIPTILTDAHGHKAFSHLGWPVRADLEPAGYFFYGDAGDWWEPRVPDAADAMRDVYENYTEACDKARMFSLAASARFSWENTAKGVLQAVGHDRLNEFSGGEWYETKRRKFHIRTLKPWACEIAGQAYRFEPNVDYWDMADVKRMAFDAGVLDLSCMDDQGLDIGVPAPTATAAHCPTCGQTLNSQPTKADLIYAEMLRERGL